MWLKYKIHHYKGPSCFPILARYTSFKLPHPLSLSLILGNRGSVLHCYNCIISRMSYKWNPTLCNIMILTFFTQYNFVEIHPVRCIYQSYFAFYCWVICYGMHVLTLSFKKPIVFLCNPLEQLYRALLIRLTALKS